MKRIKNIIYYLLIFSICLTSFSTLVFAEDDYFNGDWDDDVDIIYEPEEEENEDEDEVPTAQEAIRDNYWAEIEEDKNLPGGIYPKYLLKPEDDIFKSVKSYDKEEYSRSTGIYKDINTLVYSPIMGDVFDDISRPEENISLNKYTETLQTIDMIKEILNSLKKKYPTIIDKYINRKTLCEQLKNNGTITEEQYNEYIDRCNDILGDYKQFEDRLDALEKEKIKNKKIMENLKKAISDIDNNPTLTEEEKKEEKYKQWWNPYLDVTYTDDYQYHNPFNFDFYTDFIRERNELNVYGDLSVNNDTQSTIIKRITRGSNLDINLSVDLSNLYKWHNTRLWGNINGVSNAFGWYLKGEAAIRGLDSQLVFVLNIPKGLSISDDTKIELLGLDNFEREALSSDEERELTEFNKQNVNNKKLVIKYRRKQNLANNQQTGVNYEEIEGRKYFDNYRKIKDVTLNVSGAKVDADVPLNQNLMITASIVGMYDEYTKVKDDIFNKYPKEAVGGYNGDKSYYFFAAKQSDAGRDAAADPDKPNLISYTFNVEEKKASHNPVVTFINDDRYYDEREVIEGTSINQNSNMPKDPEKRGYKFIEWNTRPDGSGMTFTGDTVVYEDMTVYAIYKRNRRDVEYEEHDEEPVLNIKDHYQYMIGYKDRTFKPNNKMTREEVAVMFSRLMVRRPVKGHIYNHNFKDVANTRWSATAISYMNELGLIKGYPDGTFKPEKNITRAEFAAMATRFANLTGTGVQSFVDVPSTHWANDFIARAASYGWVSGYPDGTFKPENNITRAEVVTITNRMLYRCADKDFIQKNRIEILDFKDIYTHWAYYDIIEACNGHDYTRKGTIEETWQNVNMKSFVYDK